LHWHWWPQPLASSRRARSTVFRTRRLDYILGSAAIQIVYYLALAQAYRFGDLSHVYAIARRRSAADGDADHALGLLRASAAAHWRV